MKLYCCLLSSLLSCLICGIYAKYDDNLHGPLIEPPTFEEPGTMIETTTAIEELGTMTETAKNQEKEPGIATENTITEETATTNDEPGTIAETATINESETTTDEPETPAETTTTEEPATTTQEPGTMIETITTEERETTTQEPVTMIETTTTEKPEITDTTTPITTTTTDMTTLQTTTIETTTTDMTTTDTTTIETTTTTTTVSPNNNPCTPDPIPENLPIQPQIYRKSSDCSYLKSGTILVDAHHCRRYYVCNANRAIRLRCPTNEWYDRQKFKCRHRRSVRNCPPNRN